jgi:hypothetical protein
MKTPCSILPYLGVLALSAIFFHATAVIGRGQDAASIPTWAFASGPDDFKDDALLDLRSLNEKEAGQSGFVKVDANGAFVLGDGKPARFWAINTSYKQADMATHAKFMAKRGVNLVRIFFAINNAKGGPNDIDTAERDWCWKLEAAMKKEGIYCLITPYWATQMHLPPSWGIAPGTGGTAMGIVFFDPKLQDAYKSWMKALLTENNPYTGMPLAQDPAVAVIQLQNEDSLLFWTYNGMSAPQKEALGKLFGDWLTKKYGSIDKALAQWGGSPDPNDKPADGIVAVPANLWPMTQPDPNPTDRLADSTQFFGETMYNFNKMIADYLHNDLGCKSLINAGNWKTADDAHLNDVERYSHTATDVSGVNHYYAGVHTGPQNGWAIINGDIFSSPSVLLDPRPFPLNLKHIKGIPMIITESSWVMPMAYSSEGPFLVSAYQSLTGLGAFFWFNTGRFSPGWNPPESANGFLPSAEKWTFATPDMLGTFPGAALMYRMSYIKQGDPVVHEERPLADIWARKTPVITEMSGFDPNRDSGTGTGAKSDYGLPLRTYLMGPVEVVYGGDASKSTQADLASLWDEASKTTKSATGEVVMNNDKGYCTVNAPKAQGVSAFFKNQHDFTLQDVTIHSDNDYGTVLVVSMDDKEIKSSGKILVQVGTQSRPTGWKEEPYTITQKDQPDIAGFKVVNFGGPPWLIIQAECQITVNNPGISKATALDMNGNATAIDVPLQKTASGVSFKFPDKTMYVVLN